MNSLIKRNRQVVNWRQADELRRNNSGQQQQYASLGGPPTAPQANNNFLFKLLAQKLKRVLGARLAATSSSLILALVITVVIISTQLFIVHHHVSNSSRRRLLAHMSLKGLEVDSEDEMLANSNWLCQSFAHLNKIALLAQEFHVQVVVVDPDLLDLLAGDSANKQTPEELEFSGAIGIKTKQEANQKTVIHLALVNETSGGQPNLKLFYNALKLQYHMLKYDDSSETMAPEVYRRQAHQLDDVQSDSLLDSRLKRLQEDQREMSEMVAQGGERGQQQHSLENNFEISKIYTQFMSHIFILNYTRAKSMEGMERQNDHKAKQHQQNLIGYKNKCLAANGDPEALLQVDGSRPFVSIHLFVLYNYEFQPERQWIQSSLSLDEIDRHKLLAYGVHSIDFRLPLDYYYLHEKRQTRPLEEARSMLDTPVRPERPLMQSFNVFVPNPLLDYVNNTYQHCTPSLFNISALIDGSRPMSLYLRSLDAARPLQSNGQRAMLTDQVYVAIQFMNVFSKTYGNFSFWLTGSSLLNYHKFCQLLAVTPQIKPLNRPRSLNANQENEGLLSMLSMEEEQQDYTEREELDEKTMWSLELGLFESELNASMLRDLAGAKMIGVTMISNWRHPNRDGLISFHVKDCPNLLFTLHFYQLRRDFYQRYYVTNDNMIYSNKFRRRKSKKARQEVTSRLFSNESHDDSKLLVGHHVFTMANLELCWTRLDHLHPFRVPCDAHDHLRRIYII